MRRLTPLLVGVLMLTSCGFFGGAANENERTVLIDYRSDQFANMYARYFPHQLTLRQGDTAVFQQSWNGEAHSVTFGGAIDTLGKPVWDYLDRDQQPPPAAFKQVSTVRLPDMVGQDNKVHQNGAQPCYLDVGAPPTDPNTPCPRRAQPAFTGRQAWYSSGFIPYKSTDQPTQYRVPIAADATPGTYHFVCLFHGPGMNGTLTIVPKASTIPSQAEVNQKAQAQIDLATRPLVDAFNQAKAGHFPVKLPSYKFVITGYAALDQQDPHGFESISEFIPKRIEIKVGDTLRWLVVGDAHTIAFDVPRYFPEFTVASDGRVSWNSDAVNPVAAPPLAPQAFGPSGPPPTEVHPVVVDAGPYDGSHFISSGLGGGDGNGDAGWSLTFTKAGTYQYACLIHPRMLGTVIVH